MASTPEEFHWVRTTQLSIARHYGGIKFNGQHYTYQPVCSIHGKDCDVLIRDDVLKARAKASKQVKSQSKNAAPELFDGA